MPRIILIAAFLFGALIGRAQTPPIADRLSPASCLAQMEIVRSSLKPGEAMVVFAGPVPENPGSFQINPLFQYLTGLRGPNYAAILLKEEVEFKGKKNWRFLMDPLIQKVGPEFLAQVKEASDKPYFEAFSVFDMSDWKEFMDSVLAPTRIKTVYVHDMQSFGRNPFEYNTHNFVVNWFFEEIGPGEEFGFEAQAAFNEIKNCTPETFEQRLQQLNASLVYNRKLKSSSIIDQALRVANYQELEPIIERLKSAKIQMLQHTGNISEELNAHLPADETRIRQQLENAMNNGMQAGLKALKVGKYPAEIEAEMNLAMAKRGAGRFSTATVTSGEDAGYAYGGQNSMINAKDWAILRAKAVSGPFSAEIVRSVPVNREFSELRKEIYEKIRLDHEKLIQAAWAGKTGGFERTNWPTFLKQKEIKLSRHMESNLYFAQGIEVAGEKIIGNFETQQLHPGMMVEVYTYIYFPADQNYPDEINGFGVVLKDVVNVSAVKDGTPDNTVPRSPQQLQNIIGVGN